MHSPGPVSISSSTSPDLHFCMCPHNSGCCGCPDPLYWKVILSLGLSIWLSSVQFSHSIMSDSLWPQGLQHARPPCLSPTPGVIQTHVHWVSDAIQPSHPLSSPSPPTFNLSQHQSLSKWVSSSHQVAKVLEFQLQHQGFQWIFRTDFL